MFFLYFFIFWFFVFLFFSFYFYLVIYFFIFNSYRFYGLWTLHRNSYLSTLLCSFFGILFIFPLVYCFQVYLFLNKNLFIDFLCIYSLSYYFLTTFIFTIFYLVSLLYKRERQFIIINATVFVIFILLHAYPY